MAEKSNTEMSPLCIGILAHVDAGKTTLSEALLYTSGALRRLGRVDHADAFLDTDPQERERGITIFSKQARLTWKKPRRNPSLIRRVMWIFPAKRSARSRYLTRRSSL